MRRYAEAAAPLENYLRGKPSGDGVVQAAGQLAVCYARTRYLVKAKKLYADLREKYPKHPLLAPATQQLAEAAREAGDAAWSAELSATLAEWGIRRPVEEISVAEPHAVNAPSPNAAENETQRLVRLGFDQYKAGQLNEAAEMFARVLEKRPPESVAAEITYARGQILEKLDEYDPALALYDLVIEKYPKTAQHPDAIYAAARLRMKIEQKEEAAALFARMARDYPKYAKLDAALNDWASILCELGKPDEADKLYLRLRQDFPQSRHRADAVYCLAQRAFERQDTAQANALIDELLAADPRRRSAKRRSYLRGQIALLGKDWSKIRPAFERLLAEFPECRERMRAEFWIAESDYRAKDYGAAEKRFDALAKRMPGRQEPWMAMIALRRAADRALAKRLGPGLRVGAGHRKGLPRFRPAIRGRLHRRPLPGLSRGIRGSPERVREGRSLASRRKDRDCGDGPMADRRDVFPRTEFRGRARAYLCVEARYAYPAWQAQGLVEAAKCHELLDDDKQAEECYQRILDRYGNTPYAREAKQKIEVVKARLAKRNDEG